MSVVDHINTRLNQVASFVTREDALEVINSDELTSKMRALTLRAIIATPGLPHFLYKTRIVAPYTRRGFAVIGTGTHAITLQDGPHSVRKIYPRSADMNGQERREYMDLLRHKQAFAEKHLGRFVIPQTFSIQPHPLRDHQSVVGATQPFVAATTSVRIQNTDSNPELDEFVDRSFAMQDEDAALPDVVGNRNLLLDDSSLVLVDPITLLADDPDDHQTYAKADRILRDHIS